MKSVLLSCILLSGCALSPRVPPLPLTKYDTLAVQNYAVCKEAVTKVQEYLLSEGIALMVKPEGSAVRSLTCIESTLFNKVLVSMFPIVPMGATQNGFIVVFLTGNSNFDSKTILHELLHSWGVGHSWKGVMFPLMPYMHIATGADFDEVSR